MVLRFFRKSPRQDVVDTLHGRIAAASRHPGLYLALGVPDTLEGRFESLTLHAVLTLRRLRRLPPPAGEVAQDLVDVLFRQLDRSLREMGVGDFGVPKRMKKLAQAFYGRAADYDPALDAADAAALAEALGRNVCGGTRPARALARYAIAADAELAALDLSALLRDGPSFPPPERFAEGVLP
jgi:cytochrome b pre-mRNA-processing protein 3